MHKTVTMSEGNTRLNARSRASILSLISILYLLDVCLRASRKVFWFDELFTFYLCRLPRFHDTWTAVLHGADFNPPLFYLLTRWSQHLFGEGLIATRLPSILGFWIFGACLFAFVARRTGYLTGIIAALFPFFTLAHYYAYEARAHGAVLGWCGAALLCWQRSEVGPRRHAWQCGYALSVLCGMLTHVYAVFILFPFALAELYSWKRTRQANWGILAASLGALACVTPVYLKLFRAYRNLTPAGGLIVGKHVAIHHFYMAVIGPATFAILVGVSIAAWNWKRADDRGAEAVTRGEEAIATIPGRDLVAALGFALLPVAGIVGVSVTRGPFFERYFLAATAGYAILLAFAVSRLHSPRRTAAIAGTMVVLLAADFGLALLRFARHQHFDLIEPSSKFVFGNGIDNPLDGDRKTLAAARDHDVLVIGEPDYLYFYRYAPAALRSHIYYGAPLDDAFFLNAYRRLGNWAHLDLQLTPFAPFLLTHESFYALGRADGQLMPDAGEWMQRILDAGFRLRSVDPDGDGILYGFARGEKAGAEVKNHPSASAPR